MTMDQENIRKQMLELDNRIDEARILMEGMNKVRTEGGLANDTLYRTLEEKVREWMARREELRRLLEG